MKMCIRPKRETIRNFLKQQVICLLLLPFLSLANNDPEAAAIEWMQRMSDTFQGSNYSLALIRIHKQQFEPILIEHALVDGNELVFIDYLNGPQRQILFRDNSVTYFQQDAPAYRKHGVSPPGPIPTAFMQGIEQLRDNYRFSVAGRNRSMGRPAQVIRIEPMQADRYGYWVWLDTKTGMLLRLDTVSPEGEALEHVQIMSMSMVPEPTQHMQQLAAMETPPAITISSELTKVQKTEEWHPGWLPNGFEQVSSDVHRLATTQELVDYQMYSDGLTNISIYVNKALSPDAPQAEVEQGATMLYTFTRQQIEIAVVGQIPLDTARRIASNLYPQKVQGNPN